MQRYSLSIYVNDSGKELIKDWLKTLDGSIRKRILLRLDRLKDGNFGNYKQLNEELYELRFEIGAGYRIYYTIMYKNIVLLINGGIKNHNQKILKKQMKY